MSSIDKNEYAAMKSGIDQLAKTYTELMVPLVAEVNDAMRKAQIEEPIRVAICVGVFDVLMAKVER